MLLRMAADLEARAAELRAEANRLGGSGRNLSPCCGAPIKRGDVMRDGTTGPYCSACNRYANARQGR